MPKNAASLNAKRQAEHTSDLRLALGRAISAPLRRLLSKFKLHEVLGLLYSHAKDPLSADLCVTNSNLISDSSGLYQGGSIYNETQRQALIKALAAKVYADGPRAGHLVKDGDSGIFRVQYILNKQSELTDGALIENSFTRLSARTNSTTSLAREPVTIPEEIASQSVSSSNRQGQQTRGNQSSTRPKPQKATRNERRNQTVYWDTGEKAPAKYLKPGFDELGREIVTRSTFGARNQIFDKRTNKAAPKGTKADGINFFRQYDLQKVDRVTGENCKGGIPRHEYEQKKNAAENSVQSIALSHLGKQGGTIRKPDASDLTNLGRAPMDTQSKKNAPAAVKVSDVTFLRARTSGERDNVDESPILLKRPKRV